MLLGMLLAFVGGFLVEHHDQWKVIRSERAALKKDCNKLFGRSPDADIFDRLAANSGAVAYTDSATGKYISKAECASVFGVSLYPPPIDLSAGSIPPPPPGFIPVPNPDETAALAEGERIKNLAIDNGQIAGEALFLAPWGFIAGLAVWLFYRLVRFAILG